MRFTVILAVAAAATGACGTNAGRSDSTTVAMAVDSARRDSVAPPTDDCVRGEPEPVLAASPGRARFERTGKLSAIEEMRLDDSTSIRITHGGCAHYTERYAFTLRGAVPDTADSDYWLQRGATLLTSLPVGELRTSQMKQLADTLTAEAAKADAYAYGDPVSIPELATLSLSVTREGDGVTLEIVYDVAL